MLDLWKLVLVTVLYGMAIVNWGRSNCPVSQDDDDCPCRSVAWEEALMSATHLPPHPNASTELH
jgi:hypothetical protein